MLINAETNPHANPRPDWMRLMACAVLHDAVKEWKADRKKHIVHNERPGKPATEDEINPCTGHWNSCTCRACQWDFFCGHPNDFQPFTFAFCCLILELDPRSIREALGIGPRIAP